MLLCVTLIKALLDDVPGVVTLVELPRVWWPDDWFITEPSTKNRVCMYNRPLVVLKKALYGHPKAGNRWETTFNKVVLELHWRC